jgi:hypothetical protein
MAVQVVMELLTQLLVHRLLMLVGVVDKDGMLEVLEALAVAARVELLILYKR